VVHRLFFIEGGFSPLLPSPLRPPEKKKKEEGPYNRRDPGGQISSSASTTGHGAPYQQTVKPNPNIYREKPGASPPPPSAGVVGEVNFGLAREGEDLP
jgi:hypothetical protein